LEVQITRYRSELALYLHIASPNFRANSNTSSITHSIPILETSNVRFTSNEAPPPSTIPTANGPLSNINVSHIAETHEVIEVNPIESTKIIDLVDNETRDLSPFYVNLFNQPIRIIVNTASNNTLIFPTLPQFNPNLIIRVKPAAILPIIASGSPFIVNLVNQGTTFQFTSTGSASVLFFEGSWIVTFNSHASSKLVEVDFPDVFPIAQPISSGTNLTVPQSPPVIPTRLAYEAEGNNQIFFYLIPLNNVPNEIVKIIVKAKPVTAIAVPGSPFNNGSLVLPLDIGTHYFKPGISPPQSPNWFVSSSPPSSIEGRVSKPVILTGDTVPVLIESNNTEDTLLHIDEISAFRTKKLLQLRIPDGSEDRYPVQKLGTQGEHLRGGIEIENSKIDISGTLTIPDPDNPATTIFHITNAVTNVVMDWPGVIAPPGTQSPSWYIFPRVPKATTGILMTANGTINGLPSIAIPPNTGVLIQAFDQNGTIFYTAGQLSLLT
jgi:hypothetical protein